MSPRRMEEASVAGESPDNSEQRKSSGTAEGRDPRLAVFREPDAPAETGSTTDTATDTATAVFRAPFSADAADDPADASGDVSADASAAAPAVTESETDEAGADAQDSDGSDSGAAEGSEGSVEGVKAAVEDSEPREAVEEADGPDGASAPSVADEAAAAEIEPTPEDSAADDADAGSSDDEGSDADSAPAEAGSGSGAGSEAPTDPSDSEPAQEPRSEAETEGEAEAEVEAEAASGSDAEPDSRAAADADAASGTAGETTSECSAAAEPNDARLRAAVAAWVANGGDEDSAPEDSAPEDSAPEDSESGDSAPEQDAKPASGEAPQAVTGSDTGEAADTGAASDAPRVPRTREEATPAKAETSEKAETPEKAKQGEKAESEDAAVPAEPAEDKRGIDQPTTAFKALRPGRVDQPTTALKLPRDTRRDAPEAPAERTSKFVPLRSDDAGPPPPPAPRRPDASASAPRIGPTVTPDLAPGRTTDPGRPAGGAVPGLTEAERTRQQPMPPLPPLDLLAELTNTPPPPQTPVRTAVRRVKIWTPLLLLVVIVFAIAQAVRPLPEPTLTLSADPTYTFGGEKLEMPWPEEGQGVVEVEGVGTIGSYGTEKTAPIASVAKIMTAYVILKEHPITGKQDGEQIEVDKKAGEEANRPDESTAPIKEGQKYTERQMLQLLMIPSGNNVARLLARWDATTVEAFVDKMNAAAEDLGMTKSTYTDPSGLESSTESTPADQLKLAKAVLQYDVFREIVNMPQAEIPGIGKTIYNNNNILLEPGVSGIKTGSSTPAGGNLIWTADTVIDGKSRRIIGAVMGADVDGTLDAKLQRAIQSSLGLIQAAQKGVDSATVVKKGQVVGYVDDGLGGRTPVVSTKDLKAVGWGGLQVELDLGDGGETLPHVAKAGTVVGELTVGTGPGKVSAPVALQSGTTEPAFGDRLTRIT
ncbi:D-alanyl-D-alanine carboxypeptidase [Streptomyces sp. NPDC001876]|uniref:D-alanyl-D-alanine carboxypeptidase n=1 Tax=Streptomyces sp. NPDC001876 TaxID=3154402 RepID=UPI00332E2C14